MRAFDKVPHHILFESLHALNLHPTALSWFASFFPGANAASHPRRGFLKSQRRNFWRYAGYRDLVDVLLRLHRSLTPRHSQSAGS